MGQHGTSRRNRRRRQRQRRCILALQRVLGTPAWVGEIQQRGEAAR